MSGASLDAFSSPKVAGAPARLALGTMNFGKRTDEALAKRIILRAEERGITFLDTANAYYDGESERVVGRAVKGRREAFVIATKVGLGRTGSGGGGGKNEGLSRATVLAACDASLGRLGTDYIDVYYLHAPDPKTPIEETLGAVQDLISSKKIRAWSVSNYASWQILEMFELAAKSGLARPLLSQVIYNLLVRQLEYEYFKFSARYRIHTTVYNPLAGGLLSGKYRPGAEWAKGSRFDANAMYRRRYWSERLLELVVKYEAVAPEKNLIELAYAFVARHPGVDSVLVGPASIEHLDAAIDGCQAPLSPDTLKRIDELHHEYLGTDATYAR
ncbi:MAG TPA: aldo/keto reductase [Polyangiaceae bacterium]|nr:aldo/keto reductase [Polyangiaceae bacterium]